ncbi:MAG: hypothetical protein ACRCYY_21905 [Trueperaceae bacterium]
MKMIERYAQDVIQELQARKVFKTSVEPAFLLKNLTVLDASNVAAYLDENEKYKTEGYEHKDLVAIPPWPFLWLEFKAFENVRPFIGIGDRNGNQIGILPTDSCGIFCLTRDIEEESKDKDVSEVYKFDPKIRFIVEMFVFVEVYKRAFFVELGTFTFVYFLDDEGKILHERMGHGLKLPGNYDKFFEQNGHIALVPLLAFTFANCKNVTTQDHPVPPKVAKKRIASGKHPGVTYKTLVIDPMKEVLKTEGGIETNGLKKALHICRGHFKTYTADKPLFGKVTGTFWHPMHVRGSKEHGEVKKDYKILPRHEK